MINERDYFQSLDPYEEREFMQYRLRANDAITGENRLDVKVAGINDYMQALERLFKEHFIPTDSALMISIIGPDCHWFNSK